MNFSPYIPFAASLIRAALISWGSVELTTADQTANQLASALTVIAGVAWGQYAAHKKLSTQSKQPTESTHEKSN